MTEHSILAGLASKRFPDLRRGEHNVIEAVQRGSIAVLGYGDEQKQLPQYADEWGVEQRVRAELIRWLCADKEAISHVHSRGISISSGKIEGSLDLSFTAVAFPLSFAQCVITDRIDLEAATIKTLRLYETLVGHIWAVGLNVQGDVAFARDFKATNGVMLDRAHIAGDLICSDGQFHNSGGAALSLFGAKIDGSVYLLNFRAEGEVNLRTTAIGGNFNCQGAHFHNPEPAEHEKDVPPVYALAASQLQVGGSVFLRSGFEALGRIHLINAKIGRDLDCTGARLHNPGKNVLDADRIAIGADAFFRNGFQTDGKMILIDATVEGSVDFQYAKFMGSGENGVSLETAMIKRTLIWRNIQKTSETKLFLFDTTVGRFLDDRESWPEVENLSIVGFKYGRTGGVSSPKHRREWLKRQPKKETNLQPYEQLARVLRDSGHETEARKVAIAREDMRYRWNGWKSLGRVLWGCLLKVTIGYGYLPRRALYWAVAAVLLGWLIFSAAYDRALFTPVADGAADMYQKQHIVPPGYQTFSPFVYSLDTFLPIIDLYQESKWLPNPSQTCMVAAQTRPCGAYLRTYLWFHVIIGWALTTLAVVGFTGIIRKE
jgi:hypothetical protein